MLARSVYEIPYDALWQEGVRGLVFDVDNTLLPYYEEAVPKRLHLLIECLKIKGFRLIILSNGPLKRAKARGSALGIPALGRALKPLYIAGLRAGMALREKGSSLCFIGDQIFMDILTANRMRAKSVLVAPVDPVHDEKSVLRRRGAEKHVRKRLGLAFPRSCENEPEWMILCGPMGAGKTSAGEIAAAKLSLPFYDLDEMVEEKAGKTIPAVFAERGEAGFRALETQTLRDALMKEAGVLSLGGGTLLSEENRRLLQKTSARIYLRARPIALAQRLKDADDRPLLQGARSEEEKTDRLAKLLSEREEGYEAFANYRIETDDLRVFEVAERIGEVYPRLCADETRTGHLKKA